MNSEYRGTKSQQSRVALWKLVNFLTVGYLLAPMSPICSFSWSSSSLRAASSPPWQLPTLHGPLHCPTPATGLCPYPLSLCPWFQGNPNPTSTDPGRKVTPTHMACAHRGSWTTNTDPLLGRVWFRDLLDPLDKQGEAQRSTGSPRQAKALGSTGSIGQTGWTQGSAGSTRSTPQYGALRSIEAPRVRLRDPLDKQAE